MTEVRKRIEKLYPAMRKFAFKLTGSASAADDLCNDACRLALENENQYETNTKLLSWLFRIVQNRHTDNGRSATHRKTYPMEHAERVRSLDNPEIALHMRDLKRGLEQLSADHREIIILVHVLGMEYSEVAAHLGIPLGTVQSRIARAHGKLRRILGND